MAGFPEEPRMRSRVFRPLQLAASFFALIFLGVASLAAAPPRTVAGVQQPGTQLTVDALFGPNRIEEPLVAGAEWSPDGKTLSYFRSTGEGRELWALDVATGRRRRLIAAAQLSSLLDPWPPTWLQRTGFGRRAPKRYLWSPRGGALLLRSSSRLVWYDLKTGQGRQLVAGSKPLTDPKISPDARWVSFLRDYNLWIVNVRTGRLRPLTRDGKESLRDGQLDWIYPEELGLFTAYWWSPDSSRIAYFQFDERHVLRYPLITPGSYDATVYWTRYPRAGQPNPIVRVGVVGTGGGNTVWMNTGANTNVYLPTAGWMPDGKQLAIERLNRGQTRLDLLFANASTGRTRAVLSEEDKYWINVGVVFANPYGWGGGIEFLPDGRFLWSSERTGFRHLYLYDRTGDLIRPLTSGAWEVTDLAGVDTKSGVVYFVATKESPLERQLYRVGLDGKGLARVTQQPGTHEIQMAPDDAAFLDTYSNIKTPPRQDLYATAGNRHLATLSDGRIARLADVRLGPVQFLKLHAADGTLLEAEMIKPPDFSPGKKYPALVYVYGGPGAQNVRNMWGGSRFLWHELMAQHGYIIFMLDNRGSANRGHAFETPIYHHFGSVEIQDQLVGARYLQSLPYVDGSRIGVWGWSYGGHMTLHLLFRAGKIFKTGVAVAPVTDWRQYDTIYTERYMGTPQQNPEGYRDGSPVNYAGQLQGKLLLVHGTGDDNVHFANSTELIQKLIHTNRYADHVQLMIFPGRGHPISDQPAQLQLFKRITAFLLKNL
jgi:dipeptidyl-peptidase-4